MFQPLKPLSDDIRQWIADHFTADVSALRLRHHGNDDLMHAILQIEARRKCTSKLADTLRCDAFQFPDMIAAEQSTSDALASIHSSILCDADTVADLTCGLGIDSFHFAADGRKVTAIERRPEAAAAAIANSRALGLSDRIEVINADSTEWLAATTDSFDCIFIDPARRDNLGRRCYSLADCSPDVGALLPLLRAHTGRVVVKASPMLDAEAVARQLQQVSDIYLIGTATECKELVAVVDFSLPAGTPFRLHAVTTVRGEISNITLGTDPHDADMPADTPEQGMMIYEPYPALMKAGRYRWIADRYKVSAPAPDTHLFLSRQRIGFPGKAYEIVESLDFDKRTIKEIASRRIKANVATRNFPLDAPSLVRRLKISEGGDMHVYGIRTSGRGLMLLLCRPSD
ncbi:MAG: class I SAM-dependent methyltransferase [Paramuribaculum sp.]|nr:class I SAM-dependent methyltransferase [Paramuribaculum sp.]